MTTVGLLGALDTKGTEYAWLKERLMEDGVDVLMIDVGTFSTDTGADVSSAEVIEAAGEDPETVRGGNDRGAAMTVMGRGAAAIVTRLADEGRISGVLTAGGSGNASVAAAAMKALPIGFPKLIVSTIASGDTKPFVGASDVTMMYSVVDIAGINSVSTRVLGNAAAAIAGMAKAYDAREAAPHDEHERLDTFDVDHRCGLIRLPVSKMKRPISCYRLRDGSHADTVRRCISY